MDNEGFVIDSDSKAEWAIRKIKELRSERDRLMHVCDQMIQEYQDLKYGYQEKCERESDYFLGQLRLYMSQVESKELKTCYKYKLPSGDLVESKQKEKIVQDDGLTEWLQSNMPELIKAEYKPEWSEVKSMIKIVDGNPVMITDNGEMLDIKGVKVEIEEGSFDIK